MRRHTETEACREFPGAAAHPSRAGAAMVLLSAVFFGLAGVFTKSIDAPPWTILTWRGLASAVTILVYLRLRSTAPVRSECVALDWRMWLLSLVGCLSSLTFIAAFKLTYVANVTVIYALVPFFAAAMEWSLLGRHVQRQTLLAAAMSLVGVGFLAFDSAGSGHWAGDLLAAVMMLLNALYAVLIRAFPKTDVVLSGAASSGIMFAAGWFFSSPLEVSAADFLVTVGFGLTFGLASILWTEGARRVTATETGVLSAADLPFAVFFAWALLGELPPAATGVGVLIVLISVSGYTWWKASAPQEP